MLAALAVLAELPGRLENTMFGDLSGFGQHARVVELEQLAIILSQARFVVKRIDVARTTLHEKKDDPLRAWYEIQRAWGRRLACCRLTLRKTGGRQVSESAGR
jgi:hypothetical protein